MVFFKRVQFKEELPEFVSLGFGSPDVCCLREVVGSRIIKELYILVDKFEFQVGWDLLLDGFGESWEVHRWGV